MSKVEVQKAFWECRKCGHMWVNRKPVKPIQCPKCRTYLWDREQVKMRQEVKEGYQLTLKGHQAFERIAIDRWKALYRKAVRDGDDKRIEELEAMVEEVTPSKNEGE